MVINGRNLIQILQTFYFSDGVAISDEEIVFTGGEKNFDTSKENDVVQRIIRFNTKMNAWTFIDGKNLETIRYWHKSFVFNNKVIVCGGYGRRISFEPFFTPATKVLNSTEIITIPPTEVRRGGNLNEARADHQMGILVVQGVPTLAAFGGRSVICDPKSWLSSVELWDDANECWIMSEMRLPGPGYRTDEISGRPLIWPDLE